MYEQNQFMIAYDGPRNLAQWRVGGKPEIINA